MTDKQHHTTWLLLLTSIGFFMSMMDSMIVTTASTAIRTDFHISVANLQWAMNAYNITIAALLLVGVEIGARIGQRRLYIIALLLFVAGSVACALAFNLTTLILARIFQGIGASVMTPMSMAILSSAITPEKRGKALGIWSGIGGLALIIGPALGGMIVAKLTWQWIFWINVPIGLSCSFLSWQHLPISTIKTGPLNLLDSILITGAIAGIIWSLAQITSPNIPKIVPSVFVLSLVITLWFILRQRHETQPLLQLNLFKSAALTGGILGTFFMYASMYGVVFFLPQFLQLVGRTNSMTAGIELLPWTGTLVLFAPLAGKLVDHYGERLIAICGVVLQGLGYFALALCAHQTYLWLVLPLMIAGIGLSVGGPAMQKAVVGAVPRESMGSASGLYNLSRLLGGAVGVPLSVMAFYQMGGVADLSQFTQGFTAAMISAAVLSLLGVLPLLKVTA